MNTFTSVLSCASYLRLRIFWNQPQEEINHHNVVRLVSVRLGDTYFLFLKTSERIATAKATHDERGAQTQRQRAAR